MDTHCDELRDRNSADTPVPRSAGKWEIEERTVANRLGHAIWPEQQQGATHLKKAVLQLHVQEIVFLGMGRSLGQGVRRRLRLGRSCSTRRRRHVGRLIRFRLLHD